MTGKEDVLVERFKSDERYSKALRRRFSQRSQPISLAHRHAGPSPVSNAPSFPGDSPYDRYRNGDDPNAISESVKRGKALFFSERLECFHCHGGFDFTGSVDYLDKGFAEVEFHNTGLYNLKGQFSYPRPISASTTSPTRTRTSANSKRPRCATSRFTTPLHARWQRRDVGGRDRPLTAPAAAPSRPNPTRGSASDNPNKSEFVKHFDLTAEERNDVSWNS